MVLGDARRGRHRAGRPAAPAEAEADLGEQQLHESGHGQHFEKSVSVVQGSRHAIARRHNQTCTGRVLGGHMEAGYMYMCMCMHMHMHMYRSPYNRDAGTTPMSGNSKSK